MSTDLTPLAVALVGVAGTMGAPWLTQRAHRAHARDQAERDERALEASSREQSRKEKQALCAELNGATRAYRSALREYALAVRFGGPIDERFAALKQDRAAYRKQYDQAEMVLPPRPFKVAKVANEHLGYSYRLVLGLRASTDVMQETDRVLAMIRGSLGAAVDLLRLALREDLGVIERVVDLEAQLEALPIQPRSRDVGQPLETPVEGASVRWLATHVEPLAPEGYEHPDPNPRAAADPTATEAATDEGE